MNKTGINPLNAPPPMSKNTAEVILQSGDIGGNSLAYVDSNKCPRNITSPLIMNQI